MKLPLKFSLTILLFLFLANLSELSAQAPTTINEGRHVVAKKQTLFRIAKKYKVSVADLMTWNNLSSENISIGQELIVSPGKKVTYHTVAKGETLFSISKQYAAKVKDIKKMNKLKSNDLPVGKVLMIAVE